MNVALWILQALLALFFMLASGLPKLVLPPEMLPPAPIPLPRLVMQAIGLAEVLGGLGLLLPGLAGIRPGLTPLAAGGLALVAFCGAVYQVASGEPGNALFAVGFGLLTAFVGYGRWRLEPHRRRAGAPSGAAEPRPVVAGSPRNS
jgi:hypothetical protein